jgi:NAD(P)-dependent dehydrogenase (short-subunit alcohol dehydrogenase family)
MAFGEMVVKVLRGKNIIITGASRGLGVHIARAMWDNGANLLLAARSADALMSLKDDFERDQAVDQEIHITAADFALSTAAGLILNEAQKVWGRLDGLVNNAGILGPVGPLWKNPWNAWEETIQVNLLAPVSLCRACIGWMKEGGQGKIINLSGGGATGPRPNFSAYAVAKTGVVRFTEILAEEVRYHNIQVNSIAPGALNTDMLEAVLEQDPEDVGKHEYDGALKQKKGGGASPERAARLCVFLASSASDGITGKLISAIWDPWEELPRHIQDLSEGDIYTLRRIVPGERGKAWGK